MAGLARIEDGMIQDVRIAVGSVAPTPIRLFETERLLRRKPVDASLARAAGESAAAEVRPIDDLRSTSRYRAAVVRNLVFEFIQGLGPTQGLTSEMLARWNSMDAQEAEAEILPCCGSRAWARDMVSRRVLRDERAVLAASDEAWQNLEKSDWIEAFRSHPRIGEQSAQQSPDARSAAWSAQEQRDAATADARVRAALQEGNREYERRFGRIFIVCASGKTGSEILQILQQRLQNDDETELRASAEQQRQIIQIRLRRWLRG
jgi:2-oxo-4-hydroxy-4-carboxy-5-ureidoimidazoline decarboxylase